ncbi:Cysteine-rich receptor-like protein kinase 26 [Bienertia sinuspersici]
MKIFKLYYVQIVIQLYCVSIQICQPNFAYQVCNYNKINNNGNYTQTSTYKSNLNTLLSSISSNTQTNTGFYNLSIGQAPNIVNGLALSRGNVTVEDCHGCLKNATSKLPQLCPVQKEAIAWYNSCMLRYSNRTIFGAMEEAPYLYMNNNSNIPKNINKFNQVLGNLLSSLQSEAASGARCIGPSCQIRYEEYLFYNVDTSPPTSSNITTNSGKYRHFLFFYSILYFLGFFINALLK